MPTTTPDEAQRAAWWLLGYDRLFHSLQDKWGQSSRKFEYQGEERYEKAVRIARQVAGGGVYDATEVAAMVEVYRELNA